MSWLQTLLGEIDAVDLSKPRVGNSKGKEGDVLIAELPVYLQQLYEHNERKLETVREAIAKIGDQQAVHEAEEKNEANCKAHSVKMNALLDGLHPLMREQRLIDVIFDQELSVRFGEEIEKHPAFAIRNGTTLVGCEDGQRDTIGDLLRDCLMSGVRGGTIVTATIMVERRFGADPDKKEETPAAPAEAAPAGAK